MICILSLNPSIDRFISVDNLVCGNTNYTQNTWLKAGGKGINSILAANKLGTRAELIGFCANTPGIIERKLDSEKIRYELIPAFDEIRENIKITDRQKSQITEINQAGKICDEKSVDRIIALSMNAARISSYLIMAGSAPEGCPESIYRDIAIGIAKSKIPCKCVVDSSKAPLALALDARPYIIKPNLQELEQLAGKKLESIDDIKSSALSVIKKGVGIVLVSMGCDGALLVTSDYSYYAPALICDPVCEIGAGDCMLAALVSALDSGSDLLSAFKNSMAASTASVLSMEGTLTDIELYNSLINKVTIEQR